RLHGTNEDSIFEGVGNDANLGRARADFIRSYLKNLGIDPTRLIKSYARKDQASLFGEGDTLFGGIDLKLIDRVSDEEAEVMLSEVRNVYFEFGSSYVNMTPDLRGYITRTIQYLNQHPDKKLRLVGHTDDKGSDASNLTYGKQRAELISTYFQQLGLNPQQIVTSSQGERNPIASNDTDEGREKNRRVEISVQ
ncbi:MAG: OmpA family protein, partial [Bacteroidota bacterium]